MSIVYFAQCICLYAYNIIQYISTIVYTIYVHIYSSEAGTAAEAVICGF